MRKTILAVDDEKNILDALDNILTREGYKVIKANSGKEALAILKKTKPDLVLLDHFMPGMTGREVCERIRKDNKLKDIKVAFVTVARFSAAGTNELKKMNVLDYIQKPFEYKDLIQRVKKMIA